jgi:hypothetical protein
MRDPKALQINLGHAGPFMTMTVMAKDDHRKARTSGFLFEWP